MAKVKCIYRVFSCTDAFNSGDCSNCKWDIEHNDGDMDYECRWLEESSGFYERDCKSVDFDGEVLSCGRKVIAWADNDPYIHSYTSGDRIIEHLEIDGEVFVE